MNTQSECPHLIGVMCFVPFGIVPRISSVCGGLLDRVNLRCEFSVTRYLDLFVLEHDMEINGERLLDLADQCDTLHP